MDVVHFTQLREFAHRGPLQRGLRYVKCHHKTIDQCDPMGTYDWSDGRYYPDRPSQHASEFVTASGIEYHDYITQDHRVGKRSSWEDRVVTDHWTLKSIYQKRPVFFFYRKALFGGPGLELDRHFAADAGLWDVPRVEYMNNTNYVLDVNALLRRGIRIDLGRN